jgi:hypothetical protein
MPRALWLAIFFVLLVGLGCRERQRVLQSKTSERPIWTPPQSERPVLFNVSPDNTHVAAAVPSGDGYTFVLDGKEIGKDLAVFTSMTVSLETPFSATASAGGESEFVSFSNDGAHYGYVTSKTVKKVIGHLTFVNTQDYAAVIDGVAQPTYKDLVGKPVFSADGKHFAYMAQDKRKRFVVVDGTPSGRYDDVVGEPIFSADSRHVAYLATIGEHSFVVLDGNHGHPEDRFGGHPRPIRLSSDGRRLLYQAERNRREVFVDGAAEVSNLPLTEDRHPREVAFSPDSTRYALDEDGTLTVDGAQVATFLSILKIIFSADGRHVVAVGTTGKSNELSIFKDGAMMRIDGDRVRPNSLSVTADGSRVAYAVARGDNHWAVVADQLSPQPAVEGVGSLIFSTDGKHIAYLAKNSGKIHVVVDGVAGPDWDDVALLSFAPTGAVVYAAKSRSGQANNWAILYSGHEVGRCDVLLPGGQFVFDSGSSFHTICLRQGTVYSLHAAI